MITRIIKITALLFAFFLIVGISGYLTLTLIIKSEDTVIIPDLINKDVVYALEMLTDLGLNTKVKGSEYNDEIPKNHIIFQEPDPGMELKKGRDVRIIISKGLSTVLMPNLVGLSIQQARIILEENDLCHGIQSTTYSQTVKKESVMAQVPTPGTMIKRGGCTDLLTSLGRRPIAYKMLDLAGLSLDDAILLIERNDYQLGEITSLFHKDKPLNVIVTQEPKSGFRIFEGSPVNLVINRKPGINGKASMSGATGVRLFKYRLENGFLKRHIRIRVNYFGVSSDLFNGLMKPREEAWALIPVGKEATVFLYEDGELAETKVYDAW
jgi:beta-lactam-binding protein with PASTA domain